MCIVFLDLWSRSKVSIVFTTTRVWWCTLVCPWICSVAWRSLVGFEWSNVSFGECWVVNSKVCLFDSLQVFLIVCPFQKHWKSAPILYKCGDDYKYSKSLVLLPSGNWRSTCPQLCFILCSLDVLIFFACLLYSGYISCSLDVWITFTMVNLRWGPKNPSFFRTHARMFDSKHMLKTNLAGVKFGKMPNASKESTGRYSEYTSFGRGFGVNQHMWSHGILYIFKRYSWLNQWQEDWNWNLRAWWSSQIPLTSHQDVLRCLGHGPFWWKNMLRNVCKWMLARRNRRLLDFGALHQKHVLWKNVELYDPSTWRTKVEGLLASNFPGNTLGWWSTLR